MANNSYLSNKIQNQVHEKFRIKCLLYKDFEIEMILSDDNNLISNNGDHINFNMCINDSNTLYKLTLYNITKKCIIYDRMYSMNNDIDDNMCEVFDSLDDYLLLNNVNNNSLIY